MAVAVQASSGWCAEMGGLLSRLRADRSGAAAVEFGLWSALFFLVALGALDFGDHYLKRSQLGKAVSAASLQSFEQREDVNFANLPSYVAALSDNPNVQVTLQCNGSNSCSNANRSCACLARDGGYVAQSCGAPCNGGNFTTGSTAGYYLSITAIKPFQPMFLPPGTFGQGPLSQSVTVRLQ